MKRVMALSILSALLGSAAYAQTLNIKGVNLTLGEPEAEARADISGAGMTIQRLRDDSFTLTVKEGDSIDLFGEVKIKNGKLAWIQREWYLPNTPDNKDALARLFYSAVASLLDGRDKAVCTVSVETRDYSPTSGISKATDIECSSANYKHGLTMVGVDCSLGCSIGTVTGGLTESLKQNDD